jgi:hypothetical protein
MIGILLFEMMLFEKIAIEGPQIDIGGMELLEISQKKISANECFELFMED